MPKNLNIAVYCSAAANLPAGWQQAAAALGTWIGQSGSTLVYGGVDAGLMRIVASAVKNARGTVTGVVPRLRLAMASPLNDRQIEVEDLAERKAAMQQMSDIFVILPGGYGTVDELMSTFAYINFNNLTDKRVIVCNFDNLYEPLIEQLHKFIDCGVMRPGALDCMTIVDNIDTLIKTLQTHEK